MTTSQILIVAVAMIGVLAILRSTRKRWRESQALSRQSVRERYQQLQQDRSQTRDADQVMTELERLARQIHGRVDTQFAKLEAVIRDADDRIEKLSRLMRASEGGPALDVTVGDERFETPRGAAPSGTPPAPATIAPAVDTSTRNELRAQVRALYTNGSSAEQIARALNQPIGEVQLMLSLEKTLQAASI